MNDGLYEAYTDNLEDLADGALQFAFEGAEKRCRFLPAVAELREFASEWTAQQEGKSRVSALDQIAEWKRERVEHPENFLSEAEARAFWQEATKLFGGGPERLCNGDSEREQRQRKAKP